MAAPTQPETSDVVLEAYKTVGISSPTSDQYARGAAHFVTEIINNVWIYSEKSGNTRLKILQASTVVITTIGDSKITCPTGMSEEITLSILDGTYRDNLIDTTGDAKIQLATTTTSGGTTAISSVTTEDVVGRYFVITSASTAIGEMHQIISYSTTDFTATMDSTFVGSPGSTASYLIVDEITELDEDNVLNAGGLQESFDPGKPTRFMKIMENGTESFIFNRPPDLSTYGVLIRYYANPMKLDTCDTVIQKMYLDWWDMMVTGVAWKVAEDEDDDKYGVFKGEYEAMRDDVIAKEMPFGGEWQGFEL